MLANQTIQLKNETLGDLRPDIRLPNFDRSKLRPGIAHIGVGNFQRAHQAVYLDDLQGISKKNVDWGVTGINLRGDSVPLIDQLKRQDGLFSVTAQDHRETETRVVGCMVELHDGIKDIQGVLERLLDPNIRIVTLTVTEGGYYQHEGTRDLDTSHPDVAHDISNPEAPRTALGLIAAALSIRHERGIPPFTVLSCDNLRGNGDIARKMTSQLARERDSGLGSWLDNPDIFPNSMVDRITPKTTEKTIAAASERLGVNDYCPVFCEQFRQWVIEDRFVLGRPDWELVGVQMTTNVRPYEEMKLRLLNAGHSALGYLGYLVGYREVHTVAADPRFVRFLRELLEKEATPLLRPVEGIDFSVYRESVLSRFQNAAIGDQLQRICQDGSVKLPQFIFPSIRESIVAGTPWKRLSTVVAAWIHYIRGKTESGEEIELQDPQAVRLRKLALESGDNCSLLFGCHDIFGQLGSNPEFVAQVELQFKTLRSRGVLNTLAEV